MHMFKTDNKGRAAFWIAAIIVILVIIFSCGICLYFYLTVPDSIAVFTFRINNDGTLESTGTNLNQDYTDGGSMGLTITDLPGSDAKGEQQDNASDQTNNSSASATQNTNQAAKYDAKYYGQLKVVGTDLCDKNNNPVQLKGVSTHGLNYYGEYVNEETIKWLKNDLGINVFRLAMYTAEGGGYLWNGDDNKLYLESIIDDGVRLCQENQLYVIIDWHILSDGNPNNNIDESKRFFNKISSRYNNYDNVIYEICNEPNGGVNWSEIKRYADEVIPVIRNNDPDAVILVGTPNWCQDVEKVANDPLRFDNVMYTCHFYAATHGDNYRRKLIKAHEQGAPIFVSEYGLVDAYGSGWINADEGDKWKALMDEYGISSCMWSLCNKAEGASIIRSDVSKMSDFTDDELTEHGRWLKNVMLK